MLWKKNLVGKKKKSSFMYKLRESPLYLSLNFLNTIDTDAILGLSTIGNLFYLINPILLFARYNLICWEGINPYTWSNICVFLRISSGTASLPLFHDPEVLCLLCATYWYETLGTNSWNKYMKGCCNINNNFLMKIQSEKN